MPEKDAYLIRDSGGKMRTVQAFSHRGAIRIYVEQFNPPKGEELDVKRRLAGKKDWQRFRVGK